MAYQKKQLIFTSTLIVMIFYVMNIIFMYLKTAFTFDISAHDSFYLTCNFPIFLVQCEHSRLPQILPCHPADLKRKIQEIKNQS